LSRGIFEIAEKLSLTRIFTDFLRIYTDTLDDKSVCIRFLSVYIRVKMYFSVLSICGQATKIKEVRKGRALVL